MSGYNTRVQYRSGQVAARQAFGQLGYASEWGAMIPDIQAWVADAQDLISRLKTYQYIPCQEYEVCDNRIEIPNEMALILCATFNGLPMTYLQTPGCGRLWDKSVNNRCTAQQQGFWVDECYMHFKPHLSNGSIIHLDGLQRPLDDEGFPMVAECCILAVSEYICARLCLRFRDNRYTEFERLWLKHCQRARAELNQLSNKQIENLGFEWYKMPYSASFGAVGGGWGYSGGALR